MNDSANVVAATRKELFSVECTTCKARLKVRSAEAIGQILACPKCHSMVMVAPPADWHPEGTPPVANPQVATAEVAAAGIAPWKLWSAVGVATVVFGSGIVALWSVLPDRQPTPVAVAPAVVEPPPIVEAETPAEPPSVVEAPAPVEPPAEEPVAAPVAETPPVAEPELVEAPPVVEPAPAAPAVAEPPAVEPESDPEPVPPAPVETSTADDLIHRLQTTVVGLDEPAISLKDLADLLGGLAACPIRFDAESMRAAGITEETKATVKIEGGTVEAALSAALEPLGLAFEPRGKVIVIFAEEK
jgi:hypothetical protein